MTEKLFTSWHLLLFYRREFRQFRAPGDALVPGPVVAAALGLAARVGRTRWKSSEARRVAF